MRLSAFEFRLRRVTERFIPSRGSKELDRNQHYLGSGRGICTGQSYYSQYDPCLSSRRNEAAWPRIDCLCQNRGHGLLYMRASRRGRTITTISVVVEQSWFSLAVGSIPCIPPIVRLHWTERPEDRWIGPSHPSIHEWCGNTTARMHARAACQRSPARALDQMLHNSDRPWTHVNNVPRHDARAASPRLPGSSSRRCWTTAACG